MEKKLLFLMFIVSLFMCAQAEATVLTYNGWTDDNNNIADKYDDAGENYGSRISSSPVTYHETGVSDISAVFTVGNGWTPNIELTWGGGLWDTYTGWGGHEVAQVQGSSPEDPLDLVFTPDSRYGVLINSFDLDEWAGGGGIVVDWEVLDATGTLASGTWTGNTAGTRSTVNTGLTIDDMTVGNVVTLRFMQTSGDVTYLAMDDTNFDQFGGKEAANPSPANEAIDVPREVVLNWTPGLLAAAVNGHVVYFSESFNDVNDGIGGITQSVNSYDAGRLKFGTNYYWRVDEIDAPPNSTVHPGEVWSFTVEPFASPIPGESITATASSQQSNQEPEKTIDNSGLDPNDLHSADPKAMWISEAGDPGSAWIQYVFDKPYKLHEMFVWNYNGNAILTLYGLKEVTIEYSTDGTNWSQLENVPEFAQAIGEEGYAANTTVAFNGAVAKYVKITANSNWGGGGEFFDQYGLSEVRFFRIPVHARAPYPDSGATDVDLDVVLGWRAGREAASHDVYVSADPDALILAGPVTEPAFDTASLDLALDQTYHWRIDEVNDAETTTTWQGDIWSFTTQEYRVVDDFESYNDIDPPDPESHTIFGSWSDGYLTPTENEALVGYEPPQPSYMEQTIVYDGDQSMPFFYNNTIASYSEASVNTDDLAIGRDWAKGSPTTMLLRFYGDPNNAVTEQLYVKIGDTRFDYPGDVAALAMPRWSEWPIDLTGMDLSNVTELAIGFARLGGVGGQGTVMIDAVWLNAASTMVPIFVPDAGFDDQVLGAGGYTYVGEGNYDGEALDYPGPWQSAGGDAWIHDHYYADGLPARSGQNQLYGYEENEDYVYQTLDETFIEGVTYTLSVWVGQAWSDEGVDWQLYFFTEENHQNNLIETSGIAPVGSWEQVSLEYTATAADAGKKIGIKMKGDPSLGFEDVTLFHSVPVVTLQPTVWTEKASYSPNEPIVVHFTNAAGNSTDWVGFFVDGDTSENYIDYIYLDGVIDGSVTYDAGLPTPGTYNVRLLFNDSYTVEADNVFTIE